MGAFLILKPELVNHPDFRGWPLADKSELLYHPELKGWSLGLMGGARIHKIRPPITLNAEDATLQPETASPIILNSADGALD